MTLPLELGGLTDQYARRAFEQVALQFPLTGSNVTGLTTNNLSATAGVLESQLANGATGLAKGTFSAYRAAALTVVTGTAIIFDTEEFDVSGWHNVATGSYVPQVAGYYRLSWQVTSNGVLAADVFWETQLFKNNARFKDGQLCFQRGAAAAPNSVGSAVVQANGTTDHFEVVLTHGVGATQAVLAGAAFTYFQGELIGRS